MFVSKYHCRTIPFWARVIWLPTVSLRLSRQGRDGHLRRQSLSSPSRPSQKLHIKYDLSSVQYSFVVVMSGSKINEFLLSSSYNCLNSRFHFHLRRVCRFPYWSANDNNTITINLIKKKEKIISKTFYLLLFLRLRSRKIR